MMEPMSAMNTPPDSKTISLIAQDLKVDPAFVEKDWYGVQVIAAISKMTHPGYELVFSGGTALAKAHNLLERFSEDIDFRIRPIDHFPNKSALSKLKNGVIDALRDAGFQIDDESIKARDGNKFFSCMISYERQFTHSSLRPDILVEMTVDSPRIPTVHLPVGSFVATFTKKPPEVAAIGCLAFVENAADKLSALAWRIPSRVRGTTGDDKNKTLVRHLHDLTVLKDAVLKDAQFSELVRAAMETDTDRNKNEAFAALSIDDKFQYMLDILSKDTEYMDEYQQFVTGLSYAKGDSVPDFNTAVKAVRQLIQNVLGDDGLPVTKLRKNV